MHKDHQIESIRARVWVQILYMCYERSGQVASTTTEQVGCNAAHSYIYRDQLQQLPICATTIANTVNSNWLIIVAGLPLRTKGQGKGACKLQPAAVQLAVHNPTISRPSTCNQLHASCMDRQYMFHFVLLTPKPKLNSWQGQAACQCAMQYKNNGRVQWQLHTFPKALILQPRATSATMNSIASPICAKQAKLMSY